MSLIQSRLKWVETGILPIICRDNLITRLWGLDGNGISNMIEWVRLSHMVIGAGGSVSNWRPEIYYRVL